MKGLADRYIDARSQTFYARFAAILYRKHCGKLSCFLVAMAPAMSKFMKVVTATGAWGVGVLMQELNAAVKVFMEPRYDFQRKKSRASARPSRSLD